MPKEKFTLGSAKVKIFPSLRDILAAPFFGIFPYTKNTINMKALKWIIWSSVALLAIACSGGGGNTSSDRASSYDPQASDEKMAYEQEDGRPRFANDANGGEQEQLSDKKVIRTANLRMQVKSFEQASQDIRSLAQRFEAEVSNEEVRQYGDVLENNMHLRVKPERFDSLLNSLEALAIYIDFRSINAEDVSRQYIDLETRLASKRAVVERYRELLRQAKNVQEVLSVEENLRKVVEEIESVEGQLRYLSRQVEMSSIQLAFYEKTRQPLAQRSFWSQVSEGFSRGWHLLKDLAIGLISAWPVVLLLAAGLWWWARRRQRKR